MKNKIKIIILLLIVGLVLYANTFGNKFFWDDFDLITQNIHVKNFEVSSFFKSSLTSGAGKSDNLYRPLVLTSFAIDYKIWENNPFGFHLTNLALHIASAILLFLIFSLLQENWIVSSLTSFLFLVHPLQTESVTYISGRTELLPVFFILLSIYLFLKWFKSRKKLIFYLASIASFICALLSKELSVILPVILFLIYFSFFKEKLSFVGISRFFRETLPFWILSIVYVLLRFTIFNFSGQFENVNSNIFHGIGQFLKALITYWKVILIPLGLHFRLDQSLPVGFSDKEIWISALILAVIIFISIWKLIKKNNKTLFFGFTWFFIGLAPVSGILIPINYAIGERWLRLPSIGIFFMASVGLAHIIKSYSDRNHVKKLIAGGLALYISFFSAVTIKTNRLWKDAATYFNYLDKYYPNDFGVHLNLAIAYNDNNQNDKAFQEYQKALAIDPNRSLIYFNLGSFYADQKKYDKAISEYKRAIEINSNLVEAYVLLANVYMQTGKYDLAIVQLIKLRDILPNVPDPYSLLGSAYFVKKDYHNSYIYFAKALELDPSNQVLQKNVEALKGYK